jgi:hypothetical protein
VNLNWTVIISSGVSASIIGIFQFFTMRYVARLTDQVEKKLRINGKAKVEDDSK